jgi:general secretion pathway protein F
MPVFEFKGVNAAGKNIAGVLDGESLKAVRARLRKDGVVVLDIREGGSRRTGTAPVQAFGAGRVRLVDTANATRQLSTLLGAGIPLMEALSVLVEQEDKAGLKSVLSGVRDAVREGSSLGDALKQQPRVFSNLYVNMVTAGEASGALEVTLARLGDFLDEQVTFRGKMGAALLYPALMTVVGVGMLIFIFTFVMPRVVGMFADMNQQLPIITVVLLAVVNFFSNFWWLLLLLAGAGVYYGRRYLATAAGKTRFDEMLLKMPLFGPLVRMVSVSRFARTLGTLLQNGVPTLTALEIVQNVIGNTILAEAVRKARENVREGESVADPLRRSGLFPPVVVQMVAVGEKSGELEKMLLKVADSFDRTIDNRIAGLLSLLQPLIILVMAGVIGFIVVAIMLPIIDMSAGIR